MAEINSIIEMVEWLKSDIEKANDMSMIFSKRNGYKMACDDMIKMLRNMSDKEPELRRCLKSLVEVTKHLNLCPGVMSECEDVLK